MPEGTACTLHGAARDRAEAQLQSVLANPQPWAGAQDPCTHVANAQRIGYHFGERLLYADGIGWHTWGPPWRHDDLGALRIVQRLGRLIANEAADLGQWVAAAADSDEMKRRQAVMDTRFKWARLSESKQTIEASMALAAPLLACKAEALDSHPMLLGLPGGVLELDTGKHREHRHQDLITKVAGADFDPMASAPTWKRFIGEIMGDDPQLIDFLQRLAGYALSGSRGEHLLPILWGSGANGKSTFLGALQHVLGDYANSAAPGLLIQRNGNDHPTGMADLQGRRLVIVSETGEAGRLNEEQVKALTGGDMITARRMRQNFFSFKPTHLLMLQTNHRPKVIGNDEGIWRRLRLVPFAVRVPPERCDTALPDKLRTEAAGILAWAWQGWCAFQLDGLPVPDKVKAATSEYRGASDQIGAFLEECTDLGDSFSTSAGDLYRTYSSWCEDSGDQPRNNREFGMRLRDRGLKRVRSTGVRLWRGLRLADTAKA